MGRTRILRPLFAALLLAGAGPVPAVPAAEPLLLGGDERLLVLAAHPDDETLAAGGLVQEALGLDVPVRVCFFTMGDNHEIAALFTRRHPVLMPEAARASGRLRHNEALAAVTQLGLSTNDVVFLGYPDSGTLDIWNHHWRTRPPYRSAFTRATAVPYDTALTPGSAHAGEDILDDLVDVIRDFAPTHIVAPHPADHSVDHRALALFVRVALWNLAADGSAPRILAGPVHFTQWPRPRDIGPAGTAAPPDFLAASGTWLEFRLAPFQVSNKLAAIRRHHSQFLHSSACLRPLIRKCELFHELPDVALPGGAGAVELPEEDFSQFRPDPDLFRELAREAEPWHQIAGQSAAETESLADHDNDIVGRVLVGDGTHLTLATRFRRPVSRPVELSLRLFGYRPGRPFGDMPKLEIELVSGRILAARDLGIRLPEEAVELLPGGENEIVVRVPLALLGHPAKIFAGASLSKNSLPIDWAPWLVIDLADSAPAETPAATPPEFPPPPLPAVDGPGRPPPPSIRAGRPPRPPPPEPGAPAVAPAPPAKPRLPPPRVQLPRHSIPAMTEANEAVVW